MKPLMNLLRITDVFLVLYDFEMTQDTNSPIRQHCMFPIWFAAVLYGMRNAVRYQLDWLRCGKRRQSFFEKVPVGDLLSCL
jgi:hypothetical protein